MTSSRARLPSHLSQYVVEQAYARYSEEDQTVWRTVVGAIHARLERSAHPAYAQGLVRTGMTREHIPRIETMDRGMSAFGWGAVCVDGFIPPRVFQAFQAMRILPIACAVRALSHLDYTPAPDILHEAAGHAPLLVDTEYAAFVERIGAMGARTFSAPRDREAFEAIRALSILKEDVHASPATVLESEARVHASMRSEGRASEAARLARLYWWTIEYGLVGGVDDYKLYGAGLLSSLAESESCHDASVRKHVLSKACVEVAYDITRSQPQLFVAADFAHLGHVLDDVMADTAYVRGGVHALEVAAESGEEAAIRFENGVTVLAHVRGVERREGAVQVALDDVRVRAAAGETYEAPQCEVLEGVPDALVLTQAPSYAPRCEGRITSCVPAEALYLEHT